jgi:hypothetical protein
MNPRHRSIVFGLLVLAVLWLLAGGGYWYAKSSRMTAAKVRQYLESVDLSQLRDGARLSLAPGVGTNEIARRLVNWRMPVFEIAWEQQRLESFYLSLMRPPANADATAPVPPRL